MCNLQFSKTDLRAIYIPTKPKIGIFTQIDKMRADYESQITEAEIRNNLKLNHLKAKMRKKESELEAIRNSLEMLTGKIDIFGWVNKLICISNIFKSV